jgi:genome maintenance exonuclease 1
MKQYNHVGYNLPYSDLKAEYTKRGRVYTSPEGNRLLSVTTVLGVHTRQIIAEWKKRVGEDQAALISSRAASRGSAVHKLLEDHLANKLVDTTGLMPHVTSSFHQIREIADTYINNIRGLEVPVYSTHLHLAGRIDLVAEWDGKLAIIDFKTSDKFKKKEHCHQYFMQECAYSIMWEERTGIPVRKLVTVIACDNGQPQVFIEDRNTWVDPLFETIERYANELG